LGRRQGGEGGLAPRTLRSVITRVLEEHVLYFCIPAYNEAPTIGLLLWRLRKVFQEQPREYEVLVYDDGSTDATAETLEPYHKVMPLTVLGGTRVGYAAAVDALCREASRRTRYPRRDAVILLQADFTDQPEHLPELVKRFDGGADIVVGERPADASTVPAPVRSLRRLVPWVVRPFVRMAGVRDLFATLRLFRVSVIRDLVKERGDAPLLAGEGWSANADLLLRAAPHARRVETVELAPRYDVRERPSRIRPWADAMSLLRFARAARASSRRTARVHA
jgi:glycosyltransferase involved in cell wall biosynthesis